MRNVLLITRNFAPTCHVSAERATKLAKYLPEWDWRPTVLTGVRPTAGLPRDPELLDQVAGLQIIRTRAPEFSLFYASRRGRRGTHPNRGAPRRGVFHPKSWLVPDSQILWYPFAVWAALRAWYPGRWDAVLATSFPPTAILIAHTVAARLRLPYVIDFRDSWTAFHHAPQRPGWLAELERGLERRMILDAAAVVAVDPHIVEHAYSRIPLEDRPPLHVIQNGYDEDDFAGITPAPLPRFSIVHTGQLRRPPLALWEGLRHAMRERPELHGHFHVWQVGFVESGVERELNTAPAGVTVHQVPPVPQRAAVEYMLGADLLFVEEYGSIMPSKTLHYLRAARPILAFVERGGVIRDVLGSVPQAHLIGEGETVRAGRLIAELASGPRRHMAAPASSVAPYSRREIARRFAFVLDEVCGVRSPRDSGERVAVGSTSR